MARAWPAGATASRSRPMGGSGAPLREAPPALMLAPAAGPPPTLTPEARHGPVAPALARDRSARRAARRGACAPAAAVGVVAAHRPRVDRGLARDAQLAARDRPRRP